MNWPELRGRVLRLGTVALLVPLAALAAAPVAAAYSFPPIRHVFVIVLENKAFADWYTQGRRAAPYLSQTLPSEGALVPDYFGVGHDSLDNYIALISGQPPTSDTKNDCPDPLTDVPATADSNGIAQGNGCVYPSNFPTIADQLRLAGYSWGAYEQNIPSACSLDASGSDGYSRKHNPFVFFQSLRDSGQCALHDLPLSQLPIDLSSASTTPNYVFITPDECHDAHTDCADPNANLVQQQADELTAADGFLKQYVPLITASPAYKQNGLLAILFDEGDDISSCCGEPLLDPDGSMPGSLDGAPGLGGGQTGAIFLSRYIKPGTVSLEAYNHYSLLHTIEDVFGLSPLAEARADGGRVFGSDVFTNFTEPSGSGPGTGTGGSGSGTGGSGSGTGGSGSGSGPSGSGGGGSGPGTSGSGGHSGGGGGGSKGGSAKVPAACRRARPVVRRLSAKRRHGRLRVAGLASERRCARRPSVSRIRAVFVVVAHKVGRRCQFLNRKGRLTKPTSCRRAIYFRAGRSGRFSVSLKARIPRGRYLVVAVALDGGGRYGRYRMIRIRLE